MLYPKIMICNAPQGNIQNYRCDGRAFKQANASMVMENDRGPWYGCTKCSRLAQYQDFMDNRNMEYNSKLKRIQPIIELTNV